MEDCTIIVQISWETGFLMLIQYFYLEDGPDKAICQ